MRAFRTKTFSRWMRKAGLTDAALARAAAEMTSGLIDADLGGHVVKKRIALPGHGKRGAARTIVATKRGDRWFYVFGFEKNERADLDTDELKALQELATVLLGLDDRQLAVAMAGGDLVEIKRGDDDNA